MHCPYCTQDISDQEVARFLAAKGGRQKTAKKINAAMRNLRSRNRKVESLEDSIKRIREENEWLRKNLS